jgi:hypothetical protein
VDLRGASSRLRVAEVPDRDETWRGAARARRVRPHDVPSEAWLDTT